MKKVIFVTLTLFSLVISSFTFFKLNNKSENPKISKLKLQAGFVAEHLLSPSEEGLGSWVSMCFDDKGRLITSDQYGTLYRMDIAKIGSSDLKPKPEKIMIEGDSVKFGASHGLLYAFNSLYVMVNNMSIKDMPKKSGFYRLEDTNGNDKFDKMTLLKPLKGEGEHGPHSIKLSPDGKSLFIICGNYVDLPEMDHYRLPKTWKYDNLFPEIKDPRGHANDRQEPGGWVANVSPDGSKWELISAGYRNPFDLAFNDVGDLFVYDADMEWDFGMPWYRPTRICHATSASEFGWRTGNGKWASSYPDNLPSVINIGQGSPTNLMFMQNAKFPKKYRNSLLAFDWSFGIMHSILLKPTGSTYSATREEFLSGIPLSLTDGVIGPDGALYFMTGGRRLESDLYRVYYNGPESVNDFEPTVLSKENNVRRSLEKLHKTDAAAVQTAWPYLKSSDRMIRYSARLALENQPVATWKQKALDEKDPVAATQVLISLIRSADASIKNDVLKSLARIDQLKLNSSQKQDIFRTYELVISRFGSIQGIERTKLIAVLDQQYPSKIAEENRLLCKLLVSLEAPNVIAKTLALMKRNDEKVNETVATQSEDLILRNPQYGLDIAKYLEKMPADQHTFYAMMLAKAKQNWTKPQQEEYFGWYQKAFKMKGGNSYIGFIDKARKMALENVSSDKKKYFDVLSGGDLLTSSGNDIKDDDYPKGPGKNYKMDDVDKLFADNLTSRDFKRGKAMFGSTTCARCHAMNGEGGNIGPDLTQVGTRFSTKDLLESIINPSKAISDQYASTEFQMKNGASIIGKINNQDDKFYYVAQNPYTPDFVVKVDKKKVVSKQYSSVSSMLPGLINGLNPEELKDLVAYLQAGGKEDHLMFKK